MKILDSSYILHSNLDFSDGTYGITNSVLGEIRDDKANLTVNIAIRNGDIKIIDPSLKSRKKVKEIAKKTGDLERLSQADIDIIALTLEGKNSILLTDDYGVQNVASALKLKYQKLQQRGIRERFIWIKICEGCGKKYENKEEGKICRVCGSALRRKISKFIQQ